MYVLVYYIMRTIYNDIIYYNNPKPRDIYTLYVPTTQLGNNVLPRKEHEEYAFVHTPQRVDPCPREGRRRGSYQTRQVYSFL